MYTVLAIQRAIDESKRRWADEAHWCPNCGEYHADSLQVDDNTVTCLTCSESFEKGEKDE